MLLEDIQFFDILRIAIDILIVTFVIYKFILIIRGTRAVQLIKGIIVILVAWFLSGFLGLHTLRWIMSQAVIYGLFGILIIFQPELRRALEQLGRGKFLSRSSSEDGQEMEKSIEEIVKASIYMGKRRIGALISIERETGMNDYIETGIAVNGKLTSELLINIFIPNTPLHDGAVIIKNPQIMAAGCYLPLSEDPFISKELGTRHRAALGISEVTDCITLAVSEETGGISVTKNGELHRDLDEEALKEILVQSLVTESQPHSTSLWQRGAKKNG